MARDRHKNGRTTPRGTRPPHLQVVGSEPPGGSPADQLIDSAARELLHSRSPFEVESWASGLLGVSESARREAPMGGGGAPSIEEFLLHRCRQRLDAGAAVVAAGLAAVATGDFQRLARDTLDLALRRPPNGGLEWLTTVGAAAPVRGWVAADVFADQQSLIVSFSQEGMPGEHALVALVDNNLGCQVKDCWIGADAEDVVTAWREADDSHMRMDEVPVKEVLERLRDAMAASDLLTGDAELRSEDFAQHRALVWGRLRRAGLDGAPSQSRTVPEEQRAALVNDFLSSEHGSKLVRLVPDDVEPLARCLVDLRCEYEGRPLRWSPQVVGALLLDLAPRKLMLPPGQAQVLPAVLRAFVRFSTERTGLEETFVNEILAAIDNLEPVFLDRIEDVEAAGPAKALLLALQERGVDITDPEAIQSALQSDMTLGVTAPGRRRARGRLSAPPEVLACIGTSTVLARFDTLTNFYGAGRKLTQTGQPALADAKQLVGLLETADHVDAEIHGQIFKTRSAAELPELGFTVRWAVAAGALRKEHGKLRATATWAKLGAKPLERWVKAADALPTLGPIVNYYKDHRYADKASIVDDIAPGILYLLDHRPMDFEEVLDFVCDYADSNYEWLAPYMQDPANRRRLLEGELGLLSTVLGWAGVAERVGTTTEPGPAYSRERVVGGRLQLTDAGRWWLSEHEHPWSKPGPFRF